MALKSLDAEQISSWTRAQKDQWWFDNVYRGDSCLVPSSVASTAEPF